MLGIPYWFLNLINSCCLLRIFRVSCQVRERSGGMFLVRKSIQPSGGVHVIVGDVCQLREAFGSSRRQYFRKISYTSLKAPLQRFVGTQYT